MRRNTRFTAVQRLHALLQTRLELISPGGDAYLEQEETIWNCRLNPQTPLNDTYSGGKEPKDAGPEVLEPEVLPPKPDGSEARQQRPGSDRIKFVLIGLILDFLDFRTFGPLGPAGFFIGAGAVFLMLGLMNMPMQRRILISLGAGVYCLLPGTEALPLGTLLGALLKLR